MGIIRDFEDGRMEALRSITYSETGTQSPYVTTEPSVLNSLTQFFPDEASRRINDTVRIAKMLVNKPGLKWVGNQTLLSREELERKARAAAEEKNGTGVGNALAGFAAAAGQVLKIVGSTVAQVPVNGTGTHFVRAFKTDTYLQPATDPDNPIGGFAAFFGAGGIEGAPLALEGQPIILDGNPQTGLNSFPVSDNYQISINNTDNPKELGLGDVVKNKYFVDPLSEEFYIPPVDSYIQDDIARYEAQDGQTIIYDNDGRQENYTPAAESLLRNRVDDVNNGQSSKFQSTLGLSNPDLLDPDKISLASKITDLKENNLFVDTERTTQLIDYRKLKSKGYRSNTYSLDYSSGEVIKEKRVGLGNQGKKKTEINSWYETDPDPDTIDKINQLGVQLEDLSNDPITKDFIPFNFELITPEGSAYLYFRAFLDQFGDSFSGDWSATKYIGRAEDFYTYNGFSRQVSIGFKIAAATRQEIEPMYSKISTLASVTTPTYGGTASPFMRGTIARVTVGDYLSRVPGIIDSVDFNWETNYPWEINAPLPNGEEDNMLIVPHVLNCTLSFKPIHDYLPTVAAQRTPITRMIANVNKATA